MHAYPPHNEKALNIDKNHVPLQEAGSYSAMEVPRGAASSLLKERVQSSACKRTMPDDELTAGADIGFARRPQHPECQSGW